MSINMQGSWTVAVKSKEAAFNQRFIISGASSGNGTYAGNVSTPAVFVTGAHWTITIQNNPGPGWLESADQITFPSVSSGHYHFDIQSNDAGGDQDFNDLILTCSTPVNIEDYVIFGNVSYYSGHCVFNPCGLPWLVIDSGIALEAALKNPYLRVPIEKLYPERVKIPPIPLPDPPPFKPLVIPLREQTALPAQSSRVLNLPTTTESAAKASTGAEAQAVLSARTSSLPSSAATIDFDRANVASIVDHLLLACQTGALPGVALRFQQYDRTNAELVGGAYSGAGNRETLGVCATDRNGNYIFRFSRNLAQYLTEAGVDVAAGENVLTQILPDVIAQLLDPVKPAGYCYESAPYWNVPFLKQINICVPKDCIGRLPTACQGSNAIQAVGNIFIGDPPAGPPPPNQPPGYGSRVGYNNFLGLEGRITAKNTLPDVPPARCAAWFGNLDFFACFIDHPEVKFYTIRYRKLGDVGAGSWKFFAQQYAHPKIANLGIPGYSGDLVGPDPAIPALQIDAGPPIKVPAYHNIESDPAWVLTHRDRKAVIQTGALPFVTLPGSLQLRIEGYNAAGVKVAAADDSCTLYIDNTGPDFAIDSVNMLGQLGGGCALFNLQGALNTPLTIRFKANQLQRFMHSYGLTIHKGNISDVPLTNNGPGLISGAYVHGDDLVCSSFEGTFDDPAHDGAGYVLVDVVSASGSWLAPNQPFCTFAVNLNCSTRVTNGYNAAVYGYGPVQYLLGIQAT